MSFLIVLICTLIFVAVFKDAIRKAPVVFYILALVLSCLYISTAYVNYSVNVKLAFFTLMQKGTFATAIFVIVMYMGVFRDLDFVKHRLMPTRAPLSIIACILILGHVGKYLLSYLPVFGVVSSTIQAGLIISIICFILMVILGVTSFQAIKRRMNANAWVKLQRWAYLFYALVYVHLVVLLAPSAMRGGSSSWTTIIIYTVIFGIYAILRIGKALLDRKRRTSESARIPKAKP